MQQKNQEHQRYLSKLQAEISSWLEEESLEKELLNDYSSYANLDQSFQELTQILPESQRKLILEVADQILLQVSHFFHKKNNCLELEQKILLEARQIQDQPLWEIGDLQTLSFHHLEYLEEKLVAKYRLYALVEGGLAGTGHFFSASLDFPALLGINLKQLQYIASIYGYSLHSPEEQYILLKVLYAAILPQQARKEAWHELIHSQLNQASDYFLAFEENLLPPQFLETLIKQWLKVFIFLGLRKLSKKKFSLIGILLGANLNYLFTKRVAQFASYFYRYRFLLENVDQGGERHESEYEGT